MHVKESDQPTPDPTNVDPISIGLLDAEDGAYSLTATLMFSTLQETVTTIEFYYKIKTTKYPFYFLFI